MCDPVTIATTLVGVAASQALAPKPPKMPDPVAPEKPPQAAKVPDQSAMRAGQAAAAGGASVAGPASTMLTGMGGVAPGTLTLGKNTLLGA